MSRATELATRLRHLATESSRFDHELSATTERLLEESADELEALDKNFSQAANILQERNDRDERTEERDAARVLLDAALADAEKLRAVARKTSYNPERWAWRGKSYRKGGERVSALREAQETAHKASAATAAKKRVTHWEFGGSPFCGAKTSDADAGTVTAAEEDVTCKRCLARLGGQAAC